MMDCKQNALPQSWWLEKYLSVGSWGLFFFEKTPWFVIVQIIGVKILITKVFIWPCNCILKQENQKKKSTLCRKKWGKNENKKKRN